MRGLGELEAAVMDVLWSAPGTRTVREVLTELSSSRKLAYTTVMTVLDNLHRKGRVTREMDQRAYRYAPATSREEAVARALRELIDSSGDPRSVLMHFVRSASPDESDTIREALDGVDHPSDER
ncbi:BlaI/MecI/CopY family transcriptional regulator [Actinokineospora guangxiensis]|uniref:BlaI/MecI/CopY family transcriptional regulator n=1 Tax=Actinokineospora guangxiensis TaxID=1490288 RepID=A0ABW0EQ23_9PSEU